MPLNGSGSYSAPASSWNPAVTNTTINSTDWAALLADMSTALSTAIYKDGQQVPTANLPMGSFKLTGLGAGNANGNSIRYEQLFTTSAVTLLGSMNWVKGADIASASTINLTAATGNAVHVTGTTPITAVTLGSGMWRLVIFDDVLTLTHHSTNNNLPGLANITTATGDRAFYWSDGTTVYCVSYIAQSGSPSQPFTDTNPIVAGSVDPTKKVRLEVDGLTTGTTRVVTVADRDIAIGKIPTRQVLTSGTGATYTTPAGCIRLYVRMVGAGGGGSGSGSAAGNGSDGTDTTFSTFTAGKGVGGAITVGGTGGASSNGTLNLTGAAGGDGQGVNNSTGGHGASTPFGGGGFGGAAGNVAGKAAPANTGAGGGGGSQGATASAGGGGGAGGYLEGAITGPSATYTYTVGASGAGGAAGGSGANGGAGGSGLIVVDEFYC